MFENLKRRLRGTVATIQTKVNPVGRSLFLGMPEFASSRKAENYVTEGYHQNPVIHFAVNLISNSSASIKIEAVDSEDDDAEKVDNSEYLALMRRPNPTQSYMTFMKELVAYLKVHGEVFIAKNGQSDQDETTVPNAQDPDELWLLNPTNMVVKESTTGIPLLYEYRGRGPHKTFPVDIITGKSDILHIKSSDLCDNVRGLSDLAAAADAADVLNKALQWNNSLLSNQAKPSGVLSTESTIDEEQYERLVERMSSIHEGAQNAGRTMLFDNGLKWTPMSFSPLELDFANTLEKVSLYVGLSLGVPFEFLVTSSSTFNNKREAREMFYDDSIIPLMNTVLEELNNWLSIEFFNGDILRLDKDSIPALEDKRQRKFNRAIDATNAGIISPDEAREMLDFETVGGAASELWIPLGRVPLSSADTTAEMDDASKSMKLAGFSDKEVKAALKDMFPNGSQPNKSD